MPTKKPKEDTRHYGQWFIDPNPAYKEKAEMTHPEFMEHLKTAYNIDVKTTKGTKSMLSHIDGDTWFSWSYEWEIAGHKFFEHTCNKRKGMDREMWAH